MIVHAVVHPPQTMWAKVSPNTRSPAMATNLLALSSPNDKTPTATAARPAAEAVSGQTACRNSPHGRAPSTRTRSVSVEGTSRAAGHSNAAAHGKNRITSAQMTGPGEGPL